MRHLPSQRFGFLGASFPSPSSAAYRSPFGVSQALFLPPSSTSAIYPAATRRENDDFSWYLRCFRYFVRPKVPSRLGASTVRAIPPDTAAAAIIAELILLFLICTFTDFSSSPIGII